MKKILSTIVSFSLLLSIVIVPTFATETASDNELGTKIVSAEAETTETTETVEVGGTKATDAEPSPLDKSVEEEIELKITDSTDYSDYVECPTIDLPVRELTGEFTIIDDAPVFQNLNFSDALDITAEVVESSSILPMDVPENQAPVADPYIFVGNPDSMRDGKYTTETWFFIATRWNNIDLCYDPEGGPLYLAFTEDFPAGYITPLADTNYGTWAGYVINMFNVGTYPFLFAFQDAYGGMSQLFLIEFNIISRGVFETIEDSTTSAIEKSYPITVDFSAASEYTIGLMVTDPGGFNYWVYDADGVQYSWGNCQYYSSAPVIRQSVILKKPEGINGEYTFTLKIAGISSVEGACSYKIVYGTSDQRAYFFEDISNSIELPYYNTVRDYTNEQSYQYCCWSFPSDTGEYFKINATGTERVTLLANDEGFYFKILDGNTLETLYDGKNLPTYKHSQYSLYKRADLNFTAGKTYYVVVYHPEYISKKIAYELSVGDPVTISTTQQVSIPESEFTKGTTYTWTFNLETPTGGAGYADEVRYNGSGAGWPYEQGGYYYILSPGTSDWKSNGSQYGRFVKYYYENLNNPLVNAVGQWKFRLTAGQTGTYPGQDVYISYYFEV